LSARIALFAALALAPQLTPQDNAAWTRPFPPFHIAGNLYYVGSEDLASYLIATPQDSSSSTAVWRLRFH
jgi:metallo-beta-lactamase class B